MVTELESLLSSTNADIILGTESLLNPSILDGEVFPDDYSCIRKVQPGGRYGLIISENFIILGFWEEVGVFPGSAIYNAKTESFNEINRQKIKTD